MTNLVDFDRSLAAFLEDGPNSAPEAPIVAALAHARTTPRRPDLLGRFRPDVMAGAGWRPLGLRPALVLGLVALLAAGIGVAVIGSRPQDHAIVVPPPTTTPTNAPTPQPTIARFSAELLLNVAAGDPLLLTVTDTTNELAEVTSGQPGDGVSVDFGDVAVAADPTDANRLILTWSGSPCETRVDMTVDETRHSIAIAREACAGDLLPLNRIAKLRFTGPVRAADWIATIADGPNGTQPSAAASPTTADAFVPLGAPAVRPIHVSLVDTAGNPTSVDVVDESGQLTSAVAGSASDNATTLNIDVTNDSPSTLHLRWLGAPCDTVHRLTINPALTALTLDLPQCNGDAIPVGRSLILTFSAPVDPAGLTTTIYHGRGGVDMPTWTASAPDSKGNRYDLTVADPGYVVDSIEASYDPEVAATGAGPTGIQLVRTDAQTYRLVWLGSACATTPALSLDAAGDHWQLIDAPCSTSASKVLRMIDVTLQTPRASDATPSIEAITRAP